MLLHRMDRHGSRTRCDSTDAHCDSDHDLRTHGNGDALDSISDPQPDPVDHNGHHHPDRYLHSHSDLHRHQHTLTDTVPTCDRYFYIDIYFHPNIHADGYLYIFTNEYIYTHGILHTAECYTDSISHPIPNYSSPLIL